jgi:hypothetical protein
VLLLLGNPPVASAAAAESGGNLFHCYPLRISPHMIPLHAGIAACKNKTACCHISSAP